MKIIVLTLFPKMIECFFTESIIGRAVKKGKVDIEIYDLHSWGIGKWKKVDDTPYGGGAGMVLRVDVVASAIRDIKNKFDDHSNLSLSAEKKQLDKLGQSQKSKLRTILLTPQGKTYNQSFAKKFANNHQDLLLVCGHYEGFDERIREYVDEEISVGDFVLTGGELAAAVIIDSVVRLLPGVLGKEASHQEDSFSIKNDNLLEYPHYTRPEEFEGNSVPDILKSGNHAKIKKWRQEQSLKRTEERRPDLLG